MTTAPDSLLTCCIRNLLHNERDGKLTARDVEDLARLFAGFRLAETRGLRLASSDIDDWVAAHRADVDAYLCMSWATIKSGGEL